MEIKNVLVLDCNDSASKAASHLEENPAVIITKDGKYFGVIDHRSLDRGIKNLSKVKCETIISKPPTIEVTTDLKTQIEHFSSGHFKALPVLDKQKKPIGVVSRIELLAELKSLNLIPNTSISEIMSSPVKTISEEETLADAQSLLKESKVPRLVVLRKSYPLGTVSNFDIGSWTAGSINEGSKDKSKEKSTKEMKISDFVRSDIGTIDEDSNTLEAMEQMINKKVSVLAVMSGKKLVGVLGALDIFKLMAKKPSKKPVEISGLADGLESHYSELEASVSSIMKKFEKTIKFGDMRLHIKEQKSSFIVNLHLDTDSGVVSLKEEQKTFKDAVDAILSEFETILRKKKEQKSEKGRK